MEGGRDNLSFKLPLISTIQINLMLQLTSSSSTLFLTVLLVLQQNGLVVQGTPLLNLENLSTPSSTTQPLTQSRKVQLILQAKATSDAAYNVAISAIQMRIDALTPGNGTVAQAVDDVVTPSTPTPTPTPASTSSAPDMGRGGSLFLVLVLSSLLVL